MPTFIGANWKSKESSSKTQVQNFLRSILRETSSASLTEINTPHTFILTSLKDSQSKQEKILLLPNQSGVALGRLYHKEQIDADVETLIIRDYRNISSSNGKVLSDYYWGRYIFIILGESNNFELYRDPTGLSQVYFMDFEEFILFSSDIYLISKVANFQRKKLSKNWQYFSSYLSFGPLNTSATPFEEIIELLPGCVLSRKNDYTSIDIFWDPTNLSFSHTFQNDNNRIISSLDNVVNKTIKDSNNIFLQLSGGLDSTALFFSINKHKQKSQRHTIINYLCPSVSSSNESEYVKSLTKNLQVDVIFHELKYGFNPSLHVKWNRPHPALLGVDCKKDLLALLNLEGIDLINGHGGDQLFLENIDASFLVDYLLDNGFKGFLDILKKISFVNRSSATLYLHTTLKLLLKQYAGINTSQVTPLLSERKDWFTNELSNLVCPSIYNPPFWKNLITSNIYPGKISHILDVYHASAFSNFEFPGITELFPYLFQPIVELGLSIPVYETFNEHWTRLHFRQAVSEAFNTNKVWRRFKGEWSGVTQCCIRNNFKRVEELCLEGKFAQNNLVYKDLLRSHVQQIVHGKMDQQWLILQLLSLELWFEAWSENI